MEHKFLIAINSIQGSEAVEAEIVGHTEDVILALQGTFEDLIGSLPVCKKKQNEIDQRNFTVSYPVEAAIAQINTTLDIATMLLRIERICKSRCRIKDVLVSKNEDEDDF